MGNSAASLDQYQIAAASYIRVQGSIALNTATEGPATMDAAGARMRATDCRHPGASE